jgi:hypothetical protein
MDDFTVWALERLVNSVIGGFAIYLGYRLFLTAPRTRTARANGTARINAPGNFSVYLTHIGPGVFFALFGAAVLIASVYKGVNYRGSNDWSGLSGAMSPGDSARLTGQQRAAARKVIAQDIAALNEVLTALPPNLAADQQADIQLAVPRIKLELMKTVWNTDWGDEDGFRKWVEQGAVGPPPDKLAKAAEFFNLGSRGKPQ